MSTFKALLLPAFEECFFEKKILSHSVMNYIYDALSAAGGRVFCAGTFCGLSEGLLAGHYPDPENIGGFFADDAGGMAVLFFAPAPTIAPADVLGLVKAAAEDGPVSLKSAKVTLAVAGAPGDLAALDLSDLAALPALDAQGVPVVQDSESAYAAQEILRRRINMGHMKNGVSLVDPASAFISPAAVLEPGCEILPGCMIYGASHVSAGCTVGPNALLQDARLDARVRVNASQIIESHVGSGTTVGPFAYIRPGCRIGQDARIGDFVELKNSTIGRGTKVSHLTYIGDSDFGEGINVGCGVVTVNYDGKGKHRTVVEDGSFVGCNVNLVAPVKIGRNAYLAAGSTIDQDVEEGSLAIARSRQIVKPQWVQRRRQAGQL